MEEHLSDKTVPSAEDVVQMTLCEAYRWCDRLEIADYETLEDPLLLKREIVRELESRNMLQRGNSRPMLQCDTAKFASKSSDIKHLIEDIRAYFEEEKLSRLLCNQSDAYLTEEDYERAKELAEKEKPTIFIAGATSSGKSTLANALFGQALLPTGHNATSSIPCEIKQGEKKKALFQYQKCESPPKLVDLESERGQETFDSLVKKGSASKVEVFCPSDVLQHVTLIDSPGIDPKFSPDTFNPPLTEQCQIEVDNACCYILVLDASGPAERGCQVGALLEAAVNLNKSSLRPPESVVFVLNKWDVFIKGLSLSEKEQAIKDYFARLNDELESKWRKFHPSEVITINSELAAFASSLGVVTDELQNLCNKISQLLHQMKRKVFRKALKKPAILLDCAYQAIGKAKCRLKLPTESRDKNVARLEEEFKVFSESHKIAELQKKMDETLESLSDDVIAYLQSKESIARALNWQSIDKNEEIMFSQFKFDDFVTSRQRKEMYSFYKVKKPLSAMLELHIYREYRRLKQFDAKVYSTKSRSASWRSRDRENQKTSSAIDKAIFCAAMVMFFPISAIYGATELVEVFLSKNVQEEFEREYRRAVEDVSAMKRNRIKRLLQTYLIKSNRSAWIVYKEFPRLFSKFKERFLVDDLKKCSVILAKTKTVVGKVSKCRLDLETEDFTEDDIDWSYGRDRVAKGSFGDVYKVKISGKEDVALKVPRRDVTNESAEDLFRELANCRRVHKKDNFVSFYGLVRIEGNKIGFAFEWCSGGSLHEEMFGKNSNFVPSLQSKEGYCWAKQVVREIFFGLASIHNDNLVHRDVKPANIMLTSDRHVKITDVGSAKDAEEIVESECGSYAYMAPEVFKGVGYFTPVDIYSVAIIMWELWHGVEAYGGHRNKLQLAQKVANGRRPSECQPASWEDGTETTSSNWRELMKACWDPDPEKRPSAETASKSLNEL